METGRVLLLWDVDHTLIENGGVSKANYVRAFELLTGRPPVKQPQTHGRTDILIMEDLLWDNGADPQAISWEDQEEALRQAGELNRRQLEERGHALPGAAECLAAIAERADVIQSVLTGNIEPNTRVKLGAFGLDRWLDFSVGGFGSEERIRARLVPIAQAKARQRYGFDSAREATVLVGDTPLDVQAGVDGGARVIGVATGVSPLDELVAAGASVALEDLSNLAAFTGALEKARGLGPLPHQLEDVGS